MSRSGIELYRGTVERSINGKRGQAFLRELAAAMDAMPEKLLIARQLIDRDGDCCAIGVICKSRGLDVGPVDYNCPTAVGDLVGISHSMAAEIEHENDDYFGGETCEQRWQRMRRWVARSLKPAAKTERKST